MIGTRLKMRDIFGARDKTTRIAFNDRRLMRGHACSSATVLSSSFSFPLSSNEGSFLPGILFSRSSRHEKRVPGTGRDKARTPRFNNLIDNNARWHDALCASITATCPKRWPSSTRPMLILLLLSMPLSSQELAQASSSSSLVLSGNSLRVTRLRVSLILVNLSSTKPQSCSFSLTLFALLPLLSFFYRL